MTCVWGIYPAAEGSRAGRIEITSQRQGALELGHVDAEVAGQQSHVEPNRLRAAFGV